MVPDLPNTSTTFCLYFRFKTFTSEEGSWLETPPIHIILRLCLICWSTLCTVCHSVTSSHFKYDIYNSNRTSQLIVFQYDLNIKFKHSFCQVSYFISRSFFSCLFYNLEAWGIWNGFIIFFSFCTKPSVLPESLPCRPCTCTYPGWM